MIRLSCLVPFLLAFAGCAVAPPPLTPDKKAALDEFIVAYRLADAWPRSAAKIARDSLPRLEDATHADLDADKFADAASADAAHARVPALLAQGRRDLEAALRRLDADEFAAYTAYEIYAKVFEAAEIRELSAFYASATGRKLSEQAPDILAESRKPRAGDVMARHFDAAELAQIAAFWNSPVGMKMNENAERIREDMHAHFVERSEPALQQVARALADRAEGASGAATAASAASAAR